MLSMSPRPFQRSEWGSRQASASSDARARRTWSSDRAPTPARMASRAQLRLRAPRAPSSPSRHGDENPTNSHPAFSNACRSTEEVQTVYVRRALALGGSGASGGRAAALDPSLNQYRARVQQSD